MKKIAKVAVSFCLAFVLLVASLPAMAVHAESAFVPRTETPSSDNPYYFSDLNLYYRYGYGMPNCTAYAYGRIYEILGHEPNLSRWNAGQWWFDNINYGWYSYGSVPKVGSVLCWDRWDQNTGHVAVVEAVYSNGTILISESAWGGTMFRTRVMNADGSGYLTGYRFLGYIYASEELGSGTVQEPDNTEDSDTVVERPMLAIGSRGSYVTELQQKLYELGYMNTAPDGAFGSMTYSAVRVFQTANGLVEDGIVGPASWAKLLSSDVIGASSNGIGEDPEEPKEEPKEEPEVKPTEPSVPEDNTTVSEFDPVSMPLLRWGSRNSSVVLLQQKLNEKGYNAGSADGIFGGGTYNAVVAFQKANDLDADGIVGYNTWKALAGNSVEAPAEEPEETPEDPAEPDNSADTFDPASMPLLYMWKTGDSVKRLQELLNAKGYNAGTVDGIFGGATYNAVIAFQKANGLTVDGYVGTMTWTALAK